MRQNPLLGGLALLLLLSACGRQESPPPEARSAPEVTAPVETVALTTVSDSYEATGTVRSRTTIVLSSQVMGTVTAVHVREGDRVKAGQPLVEIDAREARARLDKARAGLREAENGLQEVERSVAAAEAGKAAAEANLELAATTFQRFQALLERHSVSPQEFDEVRAKHRSAQAEVDRATDSIAALQSRRNQMLARIDQARADIANAEVYLGHARVTAPQDALVTAKSAEAGALATPGMPLLTLEDPSRYRLEAAVEESRIGNVRIGEAVPVRIDAVGAEPLPGRVSEIVPAADPATRTYTVKVEITAAPQEGPSLRSGLFGRALFPMGERQVIAVPRGAVVERGQLVGVYALDGEGLARLRLIKTGRERDGRVEVLAGLAEGDRIVAADVDQVTDGARVRPAAEK